MSLAPSHAAGVVLVSNFDEAHSKSHARPTKERLDCTDPEDQRATRVTALENQHLQRRLRNSNAQSIGEAAEQVQAS